MEKSSSGRNETNQKLFDSYCKRILKNEATDCFREIQKHRQREIFFSELSEKEWKQLYMEDEYDLDTCNFRVLGYDVEVKDALIAEALPGHFMMSLTIPISVWMKIFAGDCRRN